MDYRGVWALRLDVTVISCIYKTLVDGGDVFPSIVDKWGMWVIIRILWGLQWVSVGSTLKSVE